MSKHKYRGASHASVTCSLCNIEVKQRHTYAVDFPGLKLEHETWGVKRMFPATKRVCRKCAKRAMSQVKMVAEANGVRR